MQKDILQRISRKLERPTLVLSQYFQLHNKFLSNKNVGSINFIAQQFVAVSSGTLSIIHTKMNYYITEVTSKQNFHMDKNQFIIYQ